MTAHPLNAEGDFYVEHGCCTSCDVPMQSAPTLFAYDETSHCFVKRQPVTRSECAMMFEAIRGAELKCTVIVGKTTIGTDVWLHPATWRCAINHRMRLFNHTFAQL